MVYFITLSKVCTSNDKITNIFELLVEVRQGDVLSPNLFKIFKNDLTTYLSSSRDPIGTASANSAKFREIRPRMYIKDLL